jgi:nucleotide-binding universal stress UspA family protein
MYKTILMHVNDTRRIERLLVPSVALAEEFEAHLLALSVVPPMAVITEANGYSMVIDDHCKAYRERNPELRAAFEAAVANRGFTTEWRDDDAGTLPVVDRVLPYARAADLIIASQTDSGSPISGWLDVADRLAIEAGRPVLIIPNTGTHARAGEKVLVAWNGRREAARAVFDALPILQRAKEVKVVWVNPQSEGEPPGDIPAADICAALARHAVKCEATERLGPKVNVGETLLACAEESQADLLVMGCYGHTRLREFVFGGASRHVLDKATIPVLMSH